MKALLYLGLVVLILGLASFAIPIPHTQKAGIQIGDVSLGVQTQHDEKVSPAVSGCLVLCGIVLMAVGKVRT